MKYQVNLDCDGIIDITKKIENTSAKISKSVNALQDMCSNINPEDSNMIAFKNKFGEYIESLKLLSSFYNDISINIRKFSEDFEELENNSAANIEIIAKIKGEI